MALAGTPAKRNLEFPGRVSAAKANAELRVAGARLDTPRRATFKTAPGLITPIVPRHWHPAAWLPGDSDTPEPRRLPQWVARGPNWQGPNWPVTSAVTGSMVMACGSVEYSEPRSIQVTVSHPHRNRLCSLTTGVIGTPVRHILGDIVAQDRTWASTDRKSEQ